jgi:hypothetical protein
MDHVERAARAIKDAIVRNIEFDVCAVEMTNDEQMMIAQAVRDADREAGLVLVSADPLASLETEIRLLSEQLEAANGALNAAAQGLPE